MIPKYNKVHNKFKLNDYHFDHEGLKEVAYSFIKEGDFYEQAMGDFLLNWMDEKDYIQVATSGSTGEPKVLNLSKQAMVHSAIATGDYFNLQPGDRALHCLPATYVAGKMMMVRAIILGLEIDLVTPSSHPLDTTFGNYDFCAMVPLQLSHSLAQLKQIKTVIVGGAAVSKDLLHKVQDVSTAVYETYGMTETITHIAVRKINHLKTEIAPPFEALPNVELEVDDRNCLVVTAHHLNVDHIHTNDVVDLLNNTAFHLIGRYDNIINTGGVKVYPEKIEHKLSDKVDSRFFITDQRDEILGYKVALIVESETNVIENLDFTSLDKFEIPRAIYSVPKFVDTDSGKINRPKTLDLVRKKYNIKPRSEQ